MPNRLAGLVRRLSPPFRDLGIREGGGDRATRGDSRDKAPRNGRAKYADCGLDARIEPVGMGLARLVGRQIA